MKPLHLLIQELESASLIGDKDVGITSIEYDSRKVRAGSLFVAIPGLKTDGALFAREAIARGAAAMVFEKKAIEDLNVSTLIVPNARRATAELAWAFHDHPERDLLLIGITGTNGKTTVASLLHHILQSNGLKTGMIGTLGAKIGTEHVPLSRTTPEAVDLARLFSEMRDNRCTHAVMEATSIGINLERTWKLPFRIAIFTNLTRDHVDYHGSLDAYRDAKLRLFRELAAGSTAVINADDPASPEFLKIDCPTITYGINSRAAFQACDIERSRNRCRFKIVSKDRVDHVDAGLIGTFNVYNLLAAYTACRVIGMEGEAITDSLKQAPPVRGRAETVASSAPFTVVVDFAHTPDALEKILSALSELEHRRLLTIVGAGGDRDRGKRPDMASRAAKYSDRLYLTSDNPRSEDPEKILDDMCAGLPQGYDYFRSADRYRAIHQALADAEESDIVLIAGKGHETTQEIQGAFHPFDDREIAREWLEGRGFGK